jgi:hypothetical protein
MRERLGYWAEGGGAGIFPQGAWRNAARPDARPEPGASRQIAVAVNRTGSTAAITVASRLLDGRVLVQVVDCRPEAGWAWVIPRLVQMRQQRSTGIDVVLGGRSAGALIDDCAAVGIETRHMSATEMMQACSQLVNRVDELVHIDQVELNSALAGATQRISGEAWYWGQAGSADITPLVGVTAARWGLCRADFDDGNYDIEGEFPDI